jgi:hypothetical protein
VKVPFLSVKKNIVALTLNFIQLFNEKFPKNVKPYETRRTHSNVKHKSTGGTQVINKW